MLKYISLAQIVISVIIIQQTDITSNRHSSAGWNLGKIRVNQYINRHFINKIFTQRIVRLSGSPKIVAGLDSSLRWNDEIDNRALNNKKLLLTQKTTTLMRPQAGV